MAKTKPDRLKVIGELHKFERDYVRKNGDKMGNHLDKLYKKEDKRDKKN